MNIWYRKKKHQTIRKRYRHADIPEYFSSIFPFSRLAARISGTSGVIKEPHFVLLEINSGFNFFHLDDLLCSREYDLMFGKLSVVELEVIRNMTGCKKPCKYKKYNFLVDPTSNSAYKSDHFVFSLLAVSYKTNVETEKLIYPSSSLVAEFGGTLSLFLGVSFISIWDDFGLLRKFLCRADSGLFCNN